MAQMLSVSVYGKNGNGFGSGTSGTIVGLPANGVIIEPCTGVYNGVTVVSKVKFVGDVVNRSTDEYFSATAVATLITAANA